MNKNFSQKVAPPIKAPMNSCGQVNPQLQAFAAQNAAFSQRQWEVMKQDGCTPNPAAALPTWPPRNSTAFTYPVLANQEEVAGLDTATYGAPYMPTAAEQAANDPQSLVCSLPPQLRASRFLPDQPLAASALSIPDIDDAPNFDMGVNAPGSLTPMSGNFSGTASAGPGNFMAQSASPLKKVTDTATEMRSGLAMAVEHLSNLDAVPGATTLDKLWWILQTHGKSLAMWVILIIAIAALLSLVM